MNTQDKISIIQELTDLLSEQLAKPMATLNGELTRLFNRNINRLANMEHSSKEINTADCQIIKEHWNTKRIINLVEKNKLFFKNRPELPRNRAKPIALFYYQEIYLIIDGNRRISDYIKNKIEAKAEVIVVNVI